MSSYTKPTNNLNLFNKNYFSSSDSTLTQEESDNRYIKKTGTSTLTGSLTISNNLVSYGTSNLNLQCKFSTLLSCKNVSYTAGENVSYTSDFLRDTTETSSLNSGILTLPTIDGFYLITMSGKVADSTSSIGAKFFAGTDSLFDTDDDTFYLSIDNNNRRCYSFSCIKFLNSGTEIRSTFTESTTITLAKLEIILISN